MVVAVKKRCCCRHPSWHVTHRFGAVAPYPSGVGLVPDDASRGTVEVSSTNTLVCGLDYRFVAC